MNAVAMPGGDLAAEVVKALRSVVGERAVALHEPCFAGNEWQYLQECLNSGYVSSVGKFVDRFEAELAAYTGARHAVAVVNGTAALHVALQLVGVQADDEVLIPALTFVATANAVRYCGALPHFVDSEEGTLGIDAGALREYLRHCTEMRSGQCINRATGRVIRALVPCTRSAIRWIWKRPWPLRAIFSVLIEDAAESLGRSWHGRHTGTFGALGTLSFNGNKTVTTGGGGAILTNDAALARRAKHLTTTAKVPHRWEYRHDEVGYNYRMPNLNAALGCAQLEQLDGFVAAKRRLFERYRAAFSSVAGARIVARTARRPQQLLAAEPDAR